MKSEIKHLIEIMAIEKLVASQETVVANLKKRSALNLEDDYLKGHMDQAEITLNWLKSLLM